MTTVLLKAGGVMSEELQRIKNKAAQYLSDMYVEYVTVHDGRETTVRTRIINPEFTTATTNEEFDNALVTALRRCPMPTLKSLQIREMLADFRRCVNDQA